MQEGRNWHFGQNWVFCWFENTDTGKNAIQDKSEIKVMLFL